MMITLGIGVAAAAAACAVLASGHVTDVSALAAPIVEGVRYRVMLGLIQPLVSHPYIR